MAQLKHVGTLQKFSSYPAVPTKKVSDSALNLNTPRAFSSLKAITATNFSRIPSICHLLIVFHLAKFKNFESRQSYESFLRNGIYVSSNCIMQAISSGEFYNQSWMESIPCQKIINI